MIVYKTTNLINGKIYVGQDSKERPTYLGSGKLLRRAIEKYGAANFRKEVLERCGSTEELNRRETFWIQALRATDQAIGYNISPTNWGGDTYTNNPDKDLIRAKVSKGLMGHKVSEKTRHRLSQSLKGKGLGRKRVFSESHRLALSIANTGKTRPFKKRKPHTAESKLKMSQNRRGKGLGHTHNRGRKHTPEAVRAMIQAQIIPVDQFTKDLVLVARFPSIKEAAQMTGSNKNLIGQCCLGRRKTNNGYVWRHAK